MTIPTRFFLTAVLSGISVLSFAQGRILCDSSCERESNPTSQAAPGEAARNKVQIMPGGGNETVRIELPAAWDALMAELGYRPFKEFSLK